MVFIELQRESWGSSQVGMETSWNISCCLWEVKSPFELHGGARVAFESLQGNWASSCVEGGILWFFSCCSQKLGVPLEL